MADRSEPALMPQASPFGDGNPLHGIATASGKPGVTIEWISNRTQADVAAFTVDDPVLDKAAAVARRFDGDFAFRHGPSRLFVVARDGDRLEALRAAVPADKGAVIDQCHGRICLVVEGPRAADTLSKLFAVDFDARVFKPGTGLATAHHVIFSLIWRENDDRFMLFPHRSFARDMLGALARAAAEYGVEVEV
jgi:heterotetrameric sarcosine oxidase gamma subunit